MRFSIEAETINLNMHIAAIIASTRLDTKIVLKKTAFDILVEIFRTWPVRTGFSRAAWTVGFQKLGGISNKSIKWKAPTELKHDAESIGRSLGEYLEKLRGSNQFISITNRVKYSIFLEYGHSGQAPYGSVRLALRKVSGADVSKEWKKRVKRRWNAWYGGGISNIIHYGD